MSGIELEGGASDAVVDSPPVAAPVANRRRAAPTIVATILVAVVAGSGLFAAGFALGDQTSSEPGTPAGAARAFQPFWDTYAAITEHYAGTPVSVRQLVDGAIKGMLAALGDPFSFYMSPSDFTSSLQGLAGQFEGIGATITSRRPDGTEGCTPLGPACALIVVAPLPGSPADQAGLRAGDRITAVDGATVDGATVDATLARVRGPKGTVVTLTIVRGAAAPVAIAITRAVIVQPEIVAKALAGGRVGYIRLNGFSDNSTAQFVSALTADVKAGQKAIVLDLRGNLGGYVTAARTIASQFIASGPIFWEKAATGDPIPTPALPGGVAIDATIRLAVLIDRNSASASEIVAGALQDTRRGTLIGQQSYGKGTIQQFLPLDDDNGGFRLTIARWLTPNQRWINKVGLTPDVVVPVDAAAAAGGTGDAVLDRALQVLGFGATARTPGRAQAA
ncbi:MAG: S41 family peptidase [Candidatus Limnocylindrales bacterium]